MRKRYARGRSAARDLVARIVPEAANTDRPLFRVVILDRQALTGGALLEDTVACGHADFTASRLLAKNGRVHSIHLERALKAQQCSVCTENSRVHLWMCCSCFAVLCSRESAGHGFAHYRETGHCIALSLETLSFWCYADELYLEHDFYPVLARVYRYVHELKHGEPPPAKKVVRRNLNNASPPGGTIASTTPSIGGDSTSPSHSGSNTLELRRGVSDTLTTISNLSTTTTDSKHLKRRDPMPPPAVPSHPIKLARAHSLDSTTSSVLAITTATAGDAAERAGPATTTSQKPPPHLRRSNKDDGSGSSLLTSPSFDFGDTKSVNGLTDMISSRKASEEGNESDRSTPPGFGEDEEEGAEEGEEDFAHFSSLFDLPCPHLDACISRKEPSVSIEPRTKCAREGCSSVDENWVCLQCFEVYCGRYASKHMLQHHRPGHEICLSLQDLSIWCNACQEYLHTDANPKLNVVYNYFHVRKFNGEMAPQLARAVSFVGTPTAANSPNAPSWIAPSSSSSSSSSLPSPTPYHLTSSASSSSSSSSLVPSLETSSWPAAGGLQSEYPSLADFDWSTGAINDMFPPSPARSTSFR